MVWTGDVNGIKVMLFKMKCNNKGHYSLELLQVVSAPLTMQTISLDLDHNKRAFLGAGDANGPQIGPSSVSSWVHWFQTTGETSLT